MKAINDAALIAEALSGDQARDIALRALTAIHNHDETNDLTALHTELFKLAKTAERYAVEIEE